MRYKMFYYGGGITAKPGPINMAFTKEGMKFSIGLKQSINYDDIKSVQVEYQVREKGFSAGKAAAGGVLFGELGAIAGGALGGEKVVSFLKITYLLNGDERELVLKTSLADRLEQIIAKKMSPPSLTPVPPKKRPDPFKYHKKFYGGIYKGARSALGKKKQKPDIH